ncbi:MAG: carbon-nitrogen hydrolase family protein [Deltaproteobacteria bacterium]|nr:MAG: carbon-nitrogen hydrolase family protein [Deltaproteobacteria bacterium]
MVAAAIQMVAELGDINTNLEKADRLVEQAFTSGAQLVILPEFFTSGVAFHPSLLNAALPLKGKALEFLTSKAKQHNGMVGGAFISIKGDGERYNTFVLAHPDGTYVTHDKDIPTMWENCYYIGGSDDGIIQTTLGPMGIALCWELVRTQTARRLVSKVDLLLAGSCWWTLPDKNLPVPFKRTLLKSNAEIMKATPSKMARMLGVPVIHAAHAGKFEGKTPWVPGIPCRSYYLGETQIVDGSGEIIARMSREEGEGIITAPITIGRVPPVESIPEKFWIPKLHPMFLLFWHYQRLHGKRYYLRITKEYQRDV